MALLHVLKIAGLFLLWGVVGVIALLLLAVILILFVPIRYKAYASDKLGPYEIRISWLLHIVNGWVTIERGKGTAFGVNAFTCEIIGEEADKRRLQKEEKKRMKGSKKRKRRGVVKAKAAPLKDENDNSEEEIRPEGKDRRKASNKNLEKLRDFRHNTVDAVKRIGKSLKNFAKKLVKLHQKKELLADILEDERVKSTFAWCVKKLKRLVSSIRPKKLRANIRFGFEDPANTGMLLGMFGFLYTFFGDSLKVEPDFTEVCFEADGRLRGRVFLIVPVVIFLEGYFNKDLRYSITRVKSLGASGD